jgi:hypothetical protein
MRDRESVRALLLLATVMLIAGCDRVLGNDAPADAPLVQMLQTDLAAPTPIDVRLTNASAARWGYNPCSSPRLEKREGDAWVFQPDPLILCTADVFTLGAGAEDMVLYSPPLGTTSGTYRVRYRFLRADAVEVFSISNEFVVR